MTDKIDLNKYNASDAYTDTAVDLKVPLSLENYGFRILKLTLKIM